MNGSRAAWIGGVVWMAGLGAATARAQRVRWSVPVAGAVEYNLFDIDAKFGDVEPLERVLAHLSSSEGEVPPPKRARK